MQVADFLKKKRSTQKQAAAIFGLSQSGVEKIWRKYSTKGKRAITEKKRGVKGTKKINGRQSAGIRRLIKEKLPDELKLPFGLWTREAVGQLIQAGYGIVLSRRPVGRYLKLWGYIPQKPIRRAFEQRPEAGKEWLAKAYPAIKSRAAKGRRRSLFRR